MCTFETDNIIGYKKEKEKLIKYAELINEEIKKQEDGTIIIYFNKLETFNKY